MASNLPVEQAIKYIEQEIALRGLQGIFSLKFIPYYYKWHAIFYLKCKYLSLLDSFWIWEDDVSYFDASKCFASLTKRLAELDYQFRFYFNGIWG